MTSTPESGLGESVMCELPFLRLLSRDASAIEYDRPIAEARAAGATPDRIAGLEEARALALRVRDTLRERRRREAELTALFETASDLARLRDLDAVLRAIVVRARRLLNADVAYLTLDDPAAGDTYMRVTAGSVSAAFQKVRLGLGEGLGGLVAQSASPYVTSDYFNDERFWHTEPIDFAVQEEGLVAILGVPLLLANSKVIGVLFAADRRVRTFSRDEVVLAGSLAMHAAIAIESANQLAETRTALTELAAATETIRAHSESVERAAEAHEALIGLLLRGGDVADVAASVAALLGAEVCVVDDTGRALCGTVADEERQGLENAIGEGERTGRAVSIGELWVAAVSAGQQRLGALLLRGRPDLHGADLRFLERAAMVTALLLISRRSVREAEQRVRGELLADLLAEPVRDLPGLRERAALLAADLTVPHIVVVAEAEYSDKPRLGAAAAHLAATRHGLAGEHSGRTVLLLPGDDPTRVAREVVAQLRDAIQRPVTAGAAGPAEGLTGFASTHDAAVRCLSALKQLGRLGEAASARDLGFVGMLLAEGRDVPGFVDRVLGRVIDYDTRRRTDLMKTLEAYFGCGGNLVRAKDALHVHVNTVTQRLERISRLLGADWQQPERALEIQLALRLYRMLPAMDGAR
jgi:GAF domain-containing protein/sugar diacid utilization regulator